MKNLFTLILLLILSVVLSSTYGQWIPHFVDSNLYNATIIDTADIDEDGDLDIAACGNNKVQWYENNYPDTTWTKRTIDYSFFGTVGIAIRDFDGDGKLDVVASGYTDSDVRWYKNEGGTPINWRKYIIDDYFNGAEFLCVGDIDDDGDTDVVVTGSYGNSVAWYENNLPDTNWSKHLIDDGTLGGATNCEVGDIDGDGDLDVAATGTSADDLVWYENNLPNTNWNKITIDGNLDGAWGVCIADIDGDDTLDVLATGFYADNVVWYKTTDAGQTWSQNIIYPDYFDGARNAYDADIDGDGDPDVVVTAYVKGYVVWFENHLPDDWEWHTIDDGLEAANDVCTADVDGDGKLDVIATGRIAYDLIWYENLHGQIYAKNVELDKYYMEPIPTIDTIIITTNFENIYQHNFTANAIYTSSDNAYVDSTVLYDDGLHGDSLAGDGLWGGFISSLSEEEFFSVGISTFDTETSEYLYTGNQTKFTTTGPIVIDSLLITYNPFPKTYTVRPFVRNAGQTFTVENLSITMSSDDSLITYINGSISIASIAPGEVVYPTGSFTVRVDSNFSKPFRFNFEIKSEGWLYWKDTISIVTSVEDEIEIPISYKLFQNYPNPFNPTTTIKYQIPELSFVSLKVYDVLGKEIAILLNEEKPVGTYELTWIAENLPSGIYFYQLKAGSFIETKKMVLMK